MTVGIAALDSVKALGWQGIYLHSFVVCFSYVSLLYLIHGSLHGLLQCCLDYNLLNSGYVCISYLSIQ